MLDAFDEVKKDLDGRNELGKHLYGGPLDYTDNRDWLVEAYQEALDLCVYLKSELLRRDGGGEQGERRKVRAGR